MSQWGQGGEPFAGSQPVQAPPGWYPDPGGPGQRWWDGHRWTEHSGPGPAPRQAGTNGLAVASFVLSLVWAFWLGSILAVVFGHVALAQTKRTGEGGRGLAIAGLVLGYVGVALLVLFIVFASAHHHTTNYTPQ